MKKLIFCLFLILLVVFVSGCSNNDIAPKNYTVTIKAIDSDENIIETAEVSVKGKDQVGQNGVLQITLSSGTYTAIGKDTANNFIDTEQSFSVSSDTIVPLTMYKDSKTVTITAVDENKKVIENAIINIDGVDGKNTINGYIATLKIDEAYTVNIRDEAGYYKETAKVITINKDTNIVEIFLEKSPTGKVQGDLYLTTSYSPTPLIMEYGFVNYFDHKITSGKGGYSINLPAGERELTVTTNFGGETTVFVNVVAGHTTNVDIEVPLPGNFPVEEWMNGFLGDAMVTRREVVIARWDQPEITYFIDYTDGVKIDSSDHEIALMADIVRESVQVFDQVLGDVIDYREVHDQSSADIHFLFCKDGDSNIGKAQGKCSNEINTDRMIYQSKIYLNDSHVCNLYTGPPIVVHELGHSLGVSHSPHTSDLMYYSPHVIVEEWANTMEGDRMIFGLLYSLPFPTVNPFVP